MAKKEWYHQEYQLEKWLHKQLHFDGETEYTIFLVWALFVSVFFAELI